MHWTVARSSRHRLLAAAMAGVSLIAIAPVHGDPGDIFNQGAPLIGSAPPKAADVRVGDVSVSPTGAFQYGYPISVPPGRNGMQPTLSLAYSSQAPIYGTVAAGWTLTGLHLISVDTTAGRMTQVASGVKRYMSSMAGGRFLVPVSEAAPADVEQTYRAQNDCKSSRCHVVTGVPQA